MRSIALVALVVPSYDEAIAFYVDVLGFELVEDTDLGDGKRWVRVRPPGTLGATLLLARATTHEQAAAIGHQAGGRVFLFIETEDFWRDYRSLVDRGVELVRATRHEPYGTVAVFRDPFGNLFDLLEPTIDS